MDFVYSVFVPAKQKRETEGYISQSPFVVLTIDDPVILCCFRDPAEIIFQREGTREPYFNLGIASLFGLESNPA